MSLKFAKEWEKPEKSSLFERFGDRLHQRPPLKERLTNSLYRINVIGQKLEGLAHRMEQKDKDLFEKTTQALGVKDSMRANMYANECSEVRKMVKVVLKSQLALEQVSLRLETVREFGDVAAEMGPLAGVVHSLKGQLTGIMPEVSYELGVIGDTLNGLVIEVGESTGSSYDIEASSSEAQKILHDANAVADLRMKDRFPELPVPGAAVTEKTS